MQLLKRDSLWSLAVASLFLAFGTAVADAKPVEPRVSVARDAKDPRWLHGTVRVSAPPDVIFERLSYVDTWPNLFSDIRRLKVVKHDGPHWYTRMDTRTMDCGEHDYHIYFESNRVTKLVIDAPGIDSTGFVRIDPHKDGGSIARFSLFIETTGVLGWFIPESAVRQRQEQMVRHDLRDLAKAFAVR